MNKVSLLIFTSFFWFYPSKAQILSMATKVDYSAGVSPISIAAGDFNGDGKQDLAAANVYSNDLSVLLGNGDGTFQTQQTFAIGSGPFSVAIGDFNGDGKQDLATANFYSNDLSVIMGNGDGTFQTQQTFAIGSSPISVAIGDLNGDGKQDLVTAKLGSNDLSVLLGNGDGTFQTQQTFAIGSNSYSVTIGDFNGDGKQDLAAANFYSNDLSVLLGNGDGTFQTQQTFATGSSPISLAIGDLNGDGQPDLAAANYGSNALSVLLGNGDGTFQTQQTFATGSNPFFVTIGDLNGDGQPDLATANQNSNNISVLLGNGNGTFQTQQTFATGTNPTSVAIRDLDGDGQPDLAAANYGSNNVSVLLNQTIPQPIRYVKQGGTGAGNSWDNASGDIQAMLNATGVEEVWVAAGTYKPNRKADATGTITPNDRDNAFVMKANVKLYGGFAGTETDLNQRNWNTNKTILSADFNKDDVYDASGMLTANGSDNAYHVMVAAGALGTALIDGFTLQGGYADNNSNLLVNGVNVSRDNAGGLAVYTSSPDITNCVFTGNTATWGGGMCVNFSSSANITNCVFSGNIATTMGGGILNANSSSSRVINCIFENNTGTDGGGYMSINSPVSIINSTFTKNHATSVGGAIKIAGANANISNTIIYGNTAGYAPNGQVFADGAGAGLNLSHNIIEGGITGGICTYVNGDASIDARDENPLFVSNTDYRLQCNSPAMNAGDNAAYGASISTDVDFAGLPRLATTTIDLGAYEMQMQSQNMTFAALANRTYGDAAFDPGATLSSGLSVNYTSSNTAVASIVAGKIQINGAGTTIIKGSSTCDANYAATADVHQTLVIDPKPVTVTVDAKSKMYGDADPALTYTVSPALESGDSFTGELSRVTGEDVGTYAINQNTLALSNNYVLTYAGADFTIGTKNITVTAEAKNKTYGDADPAFTYTVSPSLVSGDVFTGALSRTAGEHVGDYAINQGTLALSNNYNVTYNSANFSIGKRAIAVTADAQSKIYGDADPALTYQVTSSALVGSDVFSGSLSRVAGENVGTYAINQNTLALSNDYLLTYNTADLTIGKKTVAVTANAQNKVYGDADPFLTYAVSPALVSGDTFTGALSRAAGENVGTYAINQGTLALNSNYNINYTGNNLTIGKKAVTVTAASKTKTYGDADPAFTYAVSPSLVSGDVFIGSLNRTAGENVGTYAINQGTLTLGNNYDITYTGNDLTIGKKTIAVMAIAKTKIYGDVDPALTYSVSPALVSGDTFTGALSRAAGENVGTYAINQGTLALNSNYTITYTGNNLSITKKPIIVTANVRGKVYGEADPALTYTVSPSLVSGDALTGTLSRVSGENAGTYAINQGSLSHPNYTISFVTNVFSISKANQQINWNQTLITGCDGNTSIVLTATASSGLPVSYQSGNTAVATINNNQLVIAGPGTVTITASQAGNNNYNPATDMQKDLLSKLTAQLIVKHWDDVLFFDNSSKQYTAWQWYKNDAIVNGATGQYYNENSKLNGAYYAVVKTASGATLQTCPLTVTAGSSPILLSAFPNPVGAGQSVTIKTGYTATALQGATILVSNVQGMVLQTLQNITPQTSFNMPLIKGIYIIRLRLASGVSHSVNVMVGEQ